MASWISRFAKQNGGAEARVGVSGKPPSVVKPSNRFGALGEDDEEVVRTEAPVVKNTYVSSYERGRGRGRGRGGRHFDSRPEVVTVTAPAAPVLPDVKSSMEFPVLGGRVVSMTPKPQIAPMSFAAKAAEAARLPTPPRMTKPVAPDAPKKSQSELWVLPECRWDEAEEDLYPDMGGSDSADEDEDEGAW